MFDKNILKERIMLLDGAMGTCLSKHNLNGFNDLLNLSKPETVKSIHREYLDAGADIIETNTLNANEISLTDYGYENLCYEINLEGAKIAVEAADYYSYHTNKQRYVAGSIGISSKSLTLSPFEITFDQLEKAYLQQIKGLIDGGVDLFLVETIFDSLNAKAVMTAIDKVCKENNMQIPTILSFTFSDYSGKNFSGQTLDTIYYTFEIFPLLALGINCGSGSQHIIPYIEQLSQISRFPVCVYPNAGSPDAKGNYNQSPEDFAANMEVIVKNKWVNIIGGCCGTTSAHIKALAEMIDKYSPRELKKQ
jgi:5-methyltetrahydrofolate--homocysteine methyltransferase